MAAISSILMAGASLYSIGSTIEANKQADEARTKEGKRIEEAKGQALTKRKNLIDVQRIQSGLTGAEAYKTDYSSNVTGTKNLISDEVLG